MRIIIALLLLIFSSLSATSALQATPPPAFDCIGEEGVEIRNLAEAKATYGRRSIAILNSATLNDEEELSHLILPNAGFEIWDGDQAIVYNVRGPAAAMAFVQGLNVTDFELLVSRSGPIGVDICDQHSVELHLRRGGGADGFIVRFSYSRGRLATAIAFRAMVMRGALERYDEQANWVEEDQ